MEQKIQVSKTARYYTHGNIADAKYILYILHGYGQLAEFFIRKFHSLPKDVYIIAPEGLHRFYLKGSSGRVGASWMTKEAREDDIQDNLNWLSELDITISNQIKPIKKFVLGFSQGGATAARWYKKNDQLDALIMWASIYPPDLSLKIDIQNKHTIKQKNNHFVIGTKDQYFNSDDQKSILDFFKKNGFKTHTFEGEHTIEKPILEHILKLLKK